MKITKTVKVKECYNACTFFGVEGMERAMYCKHPFFKNKGPYAGSIITQQNCHHRVPDKCPLRKGPITIETKTELTI